MRGLPKLGGPSTGGNKRVTAPKPKKPRSMWDQINPLNLAGQAWEGAGYFLKEAASAPRYAARVVPDLARSLGAPIGGESNLDMSGNMVQDIQAGFREYTPLLADIAGGVAKTANVTGIGSDPNIIGRYQRAVEEGRWVDQAMNDFANAAIVLGPVSKALGSTASVIAPAEGMTGLTRAAAAGGGESLVRRTLSRAERPMTLREGATLGDRPVSLSSGANRGGRGLLPPDLGQARSVALKVNGETRTLPMSTPDVPAMALPDSLAVPGRGLAGRIERNARPGLTPGELYSLSKTDPVIAAQRVQAAGDVIGKVGFGAQYADTSDALLTVAGKLGKGAVKKAGPVVGPQMRSLAAMVENSRVDKALREWRDSTDLAQSFRGFTTEIEQQAIRTQYFVEDSLKKAGFDEPTRDLYGGIILDSLDRTMDSMADYWPTLRTKPEAVRTGVLREWNRKRPDEMRITPERLETYNRWRQGDIDPRVADVLATAIERMQKANEVRTANLQGTGDLLQEQREVPTRTSDSTPYDQLDPDEMRDAVEAGDLTLPYLPTETSKRQAKLTAAVEREQGRFDAATAAEAPLLSRAWNATAYRNALPEPGTDVPWVDTLQGRRDLIDERLARIDDLENQIDEALQSEGNIDEQVANLTAAIKVLDDEIIAMQDEAAPAWEMLQTKPTMKKIKVTSMDDGAAIRATAERVQQAMHEEARIEHDRRFGNETPNLTPSPGRRGPGGQRLKRSEWGGAYDTLASDSGIWSNRRSRRWYTTQGWFSRGGTGRSMEPDVFFDWVRGRDGTLTSLDDEAIARAYLDSIDRLYDTRNKGAVRREVAERVALELDMDPDMLDAALRGKRAFQQAQRTKITAAAQRIQADFQALTPDQQVAFLTDMRDLSDPAYSAEVKMQALQEMLSDTLDATERELFEDLMGELTFDEIVSMLDSGQIATQTWGRLAGEIEMSEAAKAQAQTLIDGLEAKRAAAGNNALIEQYTAQAAAIDGSMPDPRIGTNPTVQRGVWEDGTFNQDVLPRDTVVAGGEPSATGRDFTPRTTAEHLIEQEVLARKALSDAQRDSWIAGKRLERAQDKADTYLESLDETQQDMLKRNARQGVASMQHEVRRINTSGRAVGGYVPATVEANSTGGAAALDGLIGTIARRIGLYDEVLEVTSQARLAAYASDYTALSAPNGVKPMTFDEFVDMKQKDLSDEYAGRVNIAYETLNAMAEDLTGEARKVWDQSRGELDQALTADDLANSLNRFYAADNMMAGQAAYHALQSRIGHLPERLRDTISRDAHTAINDAYKAHLERWRRELNTSISRHLDEVPATFRSPLQEGRRAVTGLLRLADEEWGKAKNDPRTPEEARQAQEHRDTAMALEALAHDATTSFAAYAERQLPRPMHLIAGDGTVPKVGRVPLDNRSGRPTAVVIKDPSATSKRQEGFRVPTLRKYAAIEAREMTSIARKQAVMHIATDKAFSRSAGQIDGVTEAVADWHEEHGLDEVMPGRVLERILAERGWVVVTGATADSTGSRGGNVVGTRFNEGMRQDIVQPDGDPASMAYVTDPITGKLILRELDTLDELERLPNLRVVPDYLSTVLNDLRDPRSGWALTMYDQMTQLWKTATLAWSVAWIVYNAIGNAMMATFSYGQSPMTLVKNMDLIRNELRAANFAAGYGDKSPLLTAMRNDTLSDMVPSRMGAHGPSWAERESTMSLSSADTRLGRALDYVSHSDRSKIGRVTEFSYTLNEFTDNMFRSSVLLEDLHRRLQKEAKIPPELLDKQGRVRVDLTPAERAKLEVVQKKANDAQDAAVRAALNTMGDFTRLNPIERKVVKRIFPFWPWIRHQTAMTIRMPFQNPLRWAWMNSLSELLADDEDGDAMKHLLSGMGMTPIGMISLSAANPFAAGFTAFGSDTTGETTVFDQKSALGAINPLLKLPPKLIFGIDADQGAAMSRPMDQKPINGFGQTVGTSALARMSRIAGGDVGSFVRGAGEAAYNIAGLVPQTRGARDLALGGKPRYDSGDEIKYAEQRPGGLLAQTARTLRMPFVPIDATKLIETAEERDRKAALEARRWSLVQAARAADG